MSDSFGELPKRHKSIKKYSWKIKGLNMDNFEEIYQRYIDSTHCEKCEKEYKSRTDRCMDHSHTTGAFRNILCHSCNATTDVAIRSDNKSGYKNIYTNFDKRRNIEYWQIQIEFKGKRNIKLFNKNKWSLEEVIAQRDAMYVELGL